MRCGCVNGFFPRSGDRGAVGHLAALDSLRQLPGGASEQPAPASDGPGRTVVLAPIRGTVHRMMKKG